MAFPEDPLGLKVEIRTGTVWTDITSKAKTSDPIVHSRGIRNSGSSADPASVPLKIDNRDGAFSPRNPMSPYHGLFGLNTPVRMWIPGGAHYLDLDGNPDNYASTPDVAALDITGDLDLRWEGEANWYAAGAQMLIGKWGADGNQSYNLRLQDGALRLHVTRDGFAGPVIIAPLPALPRHAALRGVLDADNGAGGWTMRVYWAPTLAGPWTEIGNAVTGANPVTIYTSTAPLQIAPNDLDAVPPRKAVEGRVHAAEVRNGIGGTVVAAPNFESQPVGSTSFTDSAGRGWSYSGTAAVADRQDVFIGEISSWPQRWVPSEEAVWTPVQASGILRRLGQGQKPLDSTLRRRIPSGSPIAYWPFEEDRDASRAYSPITGVSPAAVTGVEWAGVDTLPSSKALPTLSAAATLSAMVPEAVDGEWQVEFVYNADDKVPPSGGSHAEVISISTTGTVRRWVVGMRGGSARIWGYDASGTDVIFKSIGIGGDVFHGWVRLRFWARDTGAGTAEYRLSWQDIGGTAGGATDTVTGSTGHVTAVTATWGALTEGWAVGHLSVLPTADDTLYDGSDRAYSGETAWERMRRLSGEEGLPMARIPGLLTPERVGPQRIAKILEVFQAAADADGGMLLEDRTRLGLVYRDRSSMYTQEPALTLVYKQPPLAPPLEPDDEADVTRNDRTVTRDGGSSARAILEEGRLSVQPPPDGIGRYDDSVTLSLADDVQAEPIAYWLLHLGTYDGARYPSVTIRLHRAPSLIPAALAMREGDLIRIKGLPGFVAYGDVDLIVTGWSETLLPRTWERTFTCEPGGPWNLAVADHATYGKADTDGSELATAATTTTTALDVRATAGLPWTTSARETPWDIQAGGEVMTVTTVGRLLNTNPWFPTDIAGWSAQNGTVTHSTTVVHPKGQGSVLITPNGSSFSGTALADQTPVGSIVPGAQYTVSLWAYSPGGWAGLQPAVNWHDAAGGYISTGSAGGFTVPAGEWTYLEQSFTAPASASRASVMGLHTNTPAATDIWYAWAVRLVGSDKAVIDTFGRTVADSWGVSDSGHTWTNSGTAADYDVAGGFGTHTHPTALVAHISRITPPSADSDLYCDVATAALPTGAALVGGPVSRCTGNDNFYTVRISFNTSGTITIILQRRLASSDTNLDTYTSPLTHTAGTFYRVRLQTIGTSIRGKFWAASTAEPDAWHLEATDSAITAANSIGVRSFRESANTNAGAVIRWDNFYLTDMQRLTVQRSVNGVVKAHAVGTAVRLAHPAITSL